MSVPPEDAPVLRTKPKPMPSKTPVNIAITKMSFPTSIFIANFWNTNNQKETSNIPIKDFFTNLDPLTNKLQINIGILIKIFSKLKEIFKPNTIEKTLDIIIDSPATPPVTNPIGLAKFSIPKENKAVPNVIISKSL